MYLMMINIIIIFPFACQTRTIRVLVLGDSGFGKTTLMNVLFSETSYPTDNLFEPVLLPPNLC